MDVDVKRARYRLTATYRFTPKLQAGLEWNPMAREVGFIGNYTLATETETRPMVNFGTSSDRIGTPPGPHAYYFTFAKSFPKQKLAPYVSINYSEYDRRLNLPFGVSYPVAPRLTTLLMNDGKRSHLLLTYTKESWSVSAMLIWMKHPGISFSFRL